jgi:hypothetical protein
MFLVRTTQIRALEQSSQAAFEEEMALHCRKFVPHLCETLSDEHLGLAIKRAIRGASTYGYTNRGPVRLFIDLTLLFGGGFASDPQYPWAAAELASDEFTSQAHRAEALYEKACEHLKQAGESSYAEALSALEQLATTAGQEGPVHPERLMASALRLIEQTCPKKYAGAGEAPLQDLISSALTKGHETYGFRRPRSTLLMIVLMLAFGHQCDQDPLYFWIKETLNDPNEPDRDVAAQRLEREAALWLKDALERQAHGGNG